jgi:hypothetical protein
MAERTYWYLGKSPTNVPYWTAVTHCETETEGQSVRALGLPRFHGLLVFKPQRLLSV